MSEEGATFKALRAADEAQSEFLALSDNWFRPVQVRTGPDGALWIVDMYRFVVEHPRWITPERMKELDLRAGADFGRIYRVYPRAKTPPAIRDLTMLSLQDLAQSLDHLNGTERDRVHQELLRRNDPSVASVVRTIARTSARPASRVQALAVLDGLRSVDAEVLLAALRDANPEVRAHAIRISENFLTNSAIADAWLKLAGDPSLRVRYQLALSLGQWSDARAAAALGALLSPEGSDPWLRAAVLSSAGPHALAIIRNLAATSILKRLPAEFIGDLVATALASDEKLAWQEVLTSLAPMLVPAAEAWPFIVTSRLLDGLERKGIKLASAPEATRLSPMLDRARDLAADSSAKDITREAALNLLGRDAGREKEERAILKNLLVGSVSSSLTKAVLDALERSRDPGLGDDLLADWTRYPPSLRSALIERLSRRKEWTASLENGIESGRIVWSELSAEQRQRLMRSDPRFQDRLQAIGALAGSSNQSRAEAIQQFEASLNLSGDPARGRKLFQALCANCHRFHDEGSSVGPNLLGLTDKSGRFLLTAILDPNAAVEGRYTSYAVELRDGRSLSGLIAEETPLSLVLLNAGGARDTVMRSELQEIRASKLSLMPEGLEANLKPQDLADLIAYIQKGPPEAGEEAAAAKWSIS